MLVSRNWLAELVPLPDSVEELTDRLTMSGLNLEGTDTHGDDVVIDLEVTSNRGDCLGHRGVAREIAVLYGEPLKFTDPPSPAADAAGTVPVAIEDAGLCPLYTARVIRGVQVGESPAWVKDRLAALGQRPVNNVADATNLAMLETGQPFHAFDLAKIGGGRIVVRSSRKGEAFVALDGSRHELPAGTGVIADAEHPVAIAGVMGGENSEISADTSDVLLEAAAFSPLRVREAGRSLNLITAAGYRFERGTDLAAVERHSRRCAELIVELAGGTIEEGVTVAGEVPGPPEPVRLRFARIPALLGIDVSADEAVSILNRLGFETAERDAESASFVPPGWRRRDVTREADLIEEVARIHGYDAIPDDAAVPVALSRKTHRDRVNGAVRSTLTGLGFYEAYTLTFVAPREADAFRFDLPGEPLRVEHSSRRAENVLRPSLLPGLLKARRDNERRGTPDAALFELARVYREANPGGPEREVEPPHLAFVCGLPFREAQGVIGEVLQRLGAAAPLTAEPDDTVTGAGGPFAAGRAAVLRLGGDVLGRLGELDPAVSGSEPWSLRGDVTAAELDLTVLEAAADFVPRVTPLPQFPAVERDLNFVLDERVPWSTLAAAATGTAGDLLEAIDFGGSFRGSQLGAGKKSYVLTLRFRSPDRTLTGEEVDAAVERVVAACGRDAGAELRT